jgi:hypothetical protein
VSDIFDEVEKIQTGAYDLPTIQDADIFDEVDKAKSAYNNLAMEQAKRVSPETAAKNYETADKTGLPLEYIERNPEASKAEEFDYDSLRKRAPLLAEMIREKRNAEIAQKELDNLSWYEEVARETKNALGMFPAAAFSASSAFYSGIASVASIGETVVRAPVELYRKGAEALGYEEQAKSAAQLSYDLTEISRGSLKIAEKEKQQAKRFDVKPTETRAHPAVWGGVQSAIMNVPAIGVSIATRNPNIALGMMGSVSYGDAYLEGKTKGLSDFESFVYGTNNAMAEVVTEKIPLGKLLNDIDANTGFLKTLGKQMISEGLTEQVATVWQDMNKWASINPEKTLKQFLDERPDAALNTLISTMVATGLQTSAISGLNALAGKQEKDTIQALVDKANESRYRELDKVNFESYLQEVAEEHGVIDHLYIDSESARSIIDQMQDEEAAQLLEAQLGEAEQLNGDIVIPVGEFASTIAPSKDYELLRDFVRLTPDAESITVNAFEQIQQANKNISNIDESKRIFKEVSDQLRATGKLTPEQARISAEIIPAFLGANPDRMGLTVEEAYEMMGLSIIGPQQEIVSERMRGRDELVDLIDSAREGVQNDKTAQVLSILESQGIDIQEDSNTILKRLSGVKEFKQVETVEEVITSDPLTDATEWRDQTVTATLEDGTTQEMNAGEAYDIINKRQKAAQSILDCINANT